MAVCDWCDQEMLKVDSCVTNIEVEYPDGVKLLAIPFDGEGGERCHDCHVLAGGYHHPGCDCETCPRCQGQLISCGCLDIEDDDDSPFSDDEWWEGSHEEDED